MHIITLPNRMFIFCLAVLLGSAQASFAGPFLMGDAEDDVWGLRDVTHNAVWVQVNGRITYGDNLIVRVMKDDCETANLLTSVYTIPMGDNRHESGVLGWNEKQVLVSLNGAPSMAEILYPVEFLMGYRFLVNFGYTSVDNLRAFFTDKEEIVMELKDSDYLKVTDRIDILSNRWSLQGAIDAITQAQKICREMALAPAPADL